MWDTKILMCWCNSVLYYILSGYKKLSLILRRKKPALIFHHWHFTNKFLLSVCGNRGPFRMVNNHCDWLENECNNNLNWLSFKHKNKYVNYACSGSFVLQLLEYFYLSMSHSDLWLCFALMQIIAGFHFLPVLIVDITHAVEW